MEKIGNLATLRGSFVMADSTQALNIQPMQISFGLLMTAIAIFAGANLGYLIVSCALSFGHTPLEVLSSLAAPGILGIVGVLCLLTWLKKKTHYPSFGEVLKIIIAGTLLLLTAAPTGFALAGAWRLHEITTQSPGKAGQQIAHGTTLAAKAKGIIRHGKHCHPSQAK